MNAHMHEIRRSLAGLMREPLNPRTDDSQYWYPLAVPSYGVDEVMQAIESMATFRTSMWQKTSDFENAFGERFGGEAIMVNSGSSADLLMIFASLRESGGTLKAGDEILVPAVTWPTHLWSVLMAGLKPVLVDADPSTLNVSVSDLKAKASTQTAGVFPVHLMGNPAPMDEIIEVADGVNAIVLEDACEALGAQWKETSVGSIGQAGSFSFFFSHHMTTMEGGMILTKDQHLAERIRLLRAHGWSRNVRDREFLQLADADIVGLDPRYTFVEWGFNVRPTELQAGFGLEQLRRLPLFENSRQANFNLFSQLLVENDLDKFLSLPVVLRDSQPSWFALPLMVGLDSPRTRDEITAFLGQCGVETRPIVAGNLAMHPVRRRFPDVFDAHLPGAEAVHSRGFYLGLYPFESSEALVRIADLLVSFMGSVKRPPN